jgi:hypothetical protein
MTPPMEHFLFDQAHKVRESEKWRLELMNPTGGAKGRPSHRAAGVEAV